MLYVYGNLLFDKALMWEYTKLATCKLLSFIATLAIVVIKGRAGLVSKITAQAIIRTSGGSDWSARIWMRYPCTCRGKTVSGITHTGDFFRRLDPHVTRKKYVRGVIMPAERFPDLFYCMVPHHFTKTNEAAMEEQPPWRRAGTESEINVHISMYWVNPPQSKRHQHSFLH